MGVVLLQVVELKRSSQEHLLRVQVLFLSGRFSHCVKHANDTNGLGHCSPHIISPRSTAPPPPIATARALHREARWQQKHTTQVARSVALRVALAVNRLQHP